ncbi:MAG TPA: phosphate ABC transporter permease PstA [Solirubrobacteraceae bacterium]|nr:phosphate ABC transporter permease PstA [Solirubrobacteraceae bacterium]
MSELTGFDPPPFDPTAPLMGSGNLRRRQLLSAVVQGGATACAIAAVAVLGIVIFVVVQRGVHSLSLGFLIRDPPQVMSGGGGGIASAIVGTALIVALATLIATPVGILCALFLVEFPGTRSRSSQLLQLALDMLQGLPSVVVGLVILGLIVVPTHADSGFAASVALAIIMLPLIARTTQEVLRTVPQGLRDATDALGVDRWRAVLTVIIPTALSGVLTGTILAVARAAGETAPVLLVDGTFSNKTTVELFGHAVPNLSVLIYELFDQPSATSVQRAWGAALVLLALILIANIGARLLLARNRRRMGL